MTDNTIRRSELPKMLPVVSSNIYSIGYDKDNKMLYVLFSKDAPAVYLEQTTEIPCKLVSFDVVQGDEKA